MKQTKKILYIIHEPDYFLMHWLHIAVGAQQSGFEVHVAAPTKGKYKTIETFGFTFHPVPMTRRQGLPWQELGSIINLIRIIKAVNPSIVHNVAIKSILYGGIAARASKSPAIVSAFTGLGYVYMSESVKAKILKYIISNGFKYVFSHNKTKVTFQNSDDCSLISYHLKLTPVNALIVHGAGIDIDKYNITSEINGIPLVILPSRMLWDKGIKEYIDAVIRLKSQGIAARFALVGDIDAGSPTSIPNSILLNWQSRNIIEWWGHRDDMPEVYAQAHIVCLPSYREGLPTVLCEAAACGRPLVATDVPGCREIVRHNVNGLLVPARNSEALSDALRTLIQNKDMRRSFGEQGRIIVKNEFSEERVVAETLSMYQELLDH